MLSPSGLGAGLSARALDGHGVNLTYVEIDPVVYDFARRYFGVPSPTGGLALEDAKVFLKRPVAQRYDYIIHDVFTGGQVPSSLFTSEFWNSTKSNLTPTGIVAINFAGPISSVAAHLIFYTILDSFSHCRAFQDGAPGPSDFRNIVIFCSTSSAPLQFRDPVEGDFLATPSGAIREKVLNTFKEFEVDLRALIPEGWWEKVEEGKGEARLEKAQLEGAKEHWRIMDKVLPVQGWVMY